MSKKEFIKEFKWAIIILTTYAAICVYIGVATFKDEMEKKRIEEAEQAATELKISELVTENWDLKEILEFTYNESVAKDEVIKGNEELIKAQETELSSTKEIVEKLKKELLEKKKRVSNIDNSNKVQPKEVKETVKTITMVATAYTAYCNGCSGTTKTGVDLRKNPGKRVIAVDPNVIALGSLVYIESDSNLVGGYYTASDIGGDIKGSRIDVFIPSKENAYKFGRRDVKVQIVKEMGK